MRRRQDDPIRICPTETRRDLHDVLNEHDRDAALNVVVRFLDRVQATTPVS